MTSSRAAAYGAIGILSIAWLASAVSVSRQPPPVRQTAAAPSPQLDVLAANVQSQSSRLRKRLADAPQPQPPARNPFSFVVRQTKTARAAAPVVEAAPAPEPLPAEPVLDLIGIAERNTPKGVVRTAMIVDAAQELHMLQEGQEIAGRYRVTAISADVVELTETTSGATRRIALK